MGYKFYKKFYKEKSERIDAGKCYYCQEPVYVSEGQALNYLIIQINEKKEEYPTHKRCRQEI